MKLRAAEWLLAAVTVAVLVGGSATQVAWVAQLCGCATGVLLSHWYDRSGRRKFLKQVAANAELILQSCTEMVVAERAKRSELEQEAAHYRRLYMQKVDGR